MLIAALGSLKCKYGISIHSHLYPMRRTKVAQPRKRLVSNVSTSIYLIVVQNVCLTARCYIYPDVSRLNIATVSPLRDKSPTIVS